MHRGFILLNSSMVSALNDLGLFHRTQASASNNSEIKGQLERFNVAIASTPAYFCLSTDRITHLQTGRDRARAHPAATAQSLSLQKMTQRANT